MRANHESADSVPRSFLRRHGIPMLLAAVLSCLGTALVFLVVRSSSRSSPEAERQRLEAVVMKEARAEAEDFLNRLVAGEYDKNPMYGPFAEKVKGYKTWSIEAQAIDLATPNCVHFDGTFTGPTGSATFSITEIKQTQQADKWVIGRFWGPNPK